MSQPRQKTKTDFAIPLIYRQGTYLKSTGIAICIIFYLLLQLKAQNDTLYFRHFNIENGLSNRNVSSIIQDSLGFMWYGTKEGLNKFDGYKFTPIKHNPLDSNSLVAEDITALAVEKSGIIWIGTRMNGLNRYDPYTEVFTLYKHDGKINESLSDNNITSLYADEIHHIIWVGTKNGLNALEMKEQKIHHFRHIEGNNSSMSGNYVNCIKVDRYGKIWIGLKNSGLDFIYFSKPGFGHIQKKANGLSSNEIRDLFPDTSGNIWIATPSGLNYYDVWRQQFTVYHHDTKNRFSIIDDDITSVYMDKYGKIWAGTKNSGLCVLYPNSKRFYNYYHEKDFRNSLSSNRINTLSQGRSGMFWAATSDGGLNSFNPLSLKFNLLKPYKLKEDQSFIENLIGIDEGNNGSFLLFNTPKEINFFDPSGTLKQSTIELKQIDKLQCFYRGNKEIYWLGGSNGLFIFDMLTHHISPIDFLKGIRGNPKDPEIKNLQNINQIFIDNNKRIWIATKGGLVKYSPINSETILINKLASVSNEIPEYPISGITQTRNGIIWFGTFGGGIFCIDPNTNQIKTYKNISNNKNSLGGNNINKLLETKDGKLWITSSGGGLNVFDPVSNTFRCYTIQDELPNNNLNGILEDDSSNLWFGCDDGICKVSIKPNRNIECRVFDQIDGLPTTEFYEGKAIKLKDGKMIFTCRNGIISFHPDSTRNNNYSTPIVISNFQLFNKQILPGDSTAILKKSISVTKDLYLKANQNSFSFEFTAISFINPGKNKYEYQLINSDKNPVFTNAQNRTATYTNVPPGDYIFKVKGSNNDGLWNEKGVSIAIHIESPYYRTWWFYCLCLLTFSLIILTVYWFRMQQLMKLQEIRNKISRDLHDEIGSTLSSISIDSEVAKQMTLGKVPEASSILENLGENSRNAIDNMSDIVWAINSENEHFGSILKRLQLFAEKFLRSRNIAAHFNIPDEIKSIELSMLQRKNIYLILKEAINNVAKYSHANNCYIHVNVQNKRVKIEVKDDGVGFEEIKDSFGGNGLLNMKKRAEEMKGIFELNSEPGKGTTVSIQFIL